MMAFVVHKGGRTTPPTEPPDPPRPRAVPPLTPEQMERAVRSLRFHLGRCPALYDLIDGLLDFADDQPPEGIERILRLLHGGYAHDRPLAAVLASWPRLRSPVRTAIEALATYCRLDDRSRSRLTGTTHAINAIVRTLTPEDAASLAAHVGHITARHSRRAETLTAGRVQGIAAAITQLTDDEIAVLAPLVAALANRSTSRTRRLRNAIRDLICGVFTRAGFASFAIVAIKQLQDPNVIDNADATTPKG